MKIKRRRMRSRPLLAATGSATLLAGCVTGATSGNLVAPPMIELCVEVEPPEAEAAVTIDGWALEDDGCNEVEGWTTHTVEATAEGYQDYAEDVEVEEDLTIKEVMELNIILKIMTIFNLKVSLA